MQARRVVGDVVGGRGEVVEPPTVHVGNVAGGVPLVVARCPRGEDGALGGHEMPVLAVGVSCQIDEKSERLGG